jgi:hypothetical protein
MVAGRDRMGLPPLSAGFVSIAARAGSDAEGLSHCEARRAHLVSRRRLELCFANYLIVVCGNFSFGLALT